ncbi:MAG: PD-(D/E)XK nuclease family protein, partial [Thaumarchaeota archaeon]|nr:PD-(D/E)XK nuclease family protein [Nitrososphaerota archaeon]
MRELWRRESAEHERRPGTFYPSYIGYCLRRQYYIYRIGEEPTSERLAVFATGKGVHEAVAEALGASGEVRVEGVEGDVKLSAGGITLSGRVDIILAEVGGRRVVVEVKSTSRLPEAPQDHHLLQLQIYLNALGVDDGVLLYWDKRRGSLRAFDVRRDPSQLNRAVERALVLNEHLRKDAPPPREAVMEGRLWECDLCEYRGICKPFLLEGIPEGERLMVAEVDGVLVDDSRRLREALVRAGVPPDTPPWKLRGELRSRFLAAYYEEGGLRLDGRGPFADYAWRRRAEGLRLVVISGRPARLRRATEEELRSLGLVWDHLLLSPEGGDPEWKARALARLA